MPSHYSLGVGNGGVRRQQPSFLNGLFGGGRGEIPVGAGGGPYGITGANFGMNGVGRSNYVSQVPQSLEAYNTRPGLRSNVATGSAPTVIMAQSHLPRKIQDTGNIKIRDPNNQTTRTDTITCLLYTSPSPRDRTRSRMPSSA